MKNQQIGILIPKFGIQKKTLRRKSVHLILYQKKGCRHTYIYSKRLPPYLHLLKTVAPISASTQNSCHHTYIYSKQLSPYLHLLKTVAAIPTSIKNGCCHSYIYSKDCHHTYIYSKKRREHFLIHEIRRIDGRRQFQTGGKVLQIGGNTFYDRKNKNQMKILEIKRSGIGIMVEFCGFPSGFCNQAFKRLLVSL